MVNALKSKVKPFFPADGPRGESEFGEGQALLCAAAQKTQQPSWGATSVSGPSPILCPATVGLNFIVDHF